MAAGIGDVLPTPAWFVERVLVCNLEFTFIHLDQNLTKIGRRRGVSSISRLTAAVYGGLSGRIDRSAENGRGQLDR